MVRLIPVSWDQKARFLKRPNRFLALARLENQEADDALEIHVRDPGRLEELLFPGNELLLRYAARPGRKTDWDLIAARCADEWVLVNSGLHAAIAKAFLENTAISPFGSPASIKGEVRYGGSRLDFFISTANDEKIYIEVKGCTLTREDTALFPDAPTARGRRHLKELISISRRGLRAAVLFLVFRSKSRVFRANRETDWKFAEALYTAHSSGVEIYPLLLEYRRGIIWYKSIIPVTFD